MVAHAGGGGGGGLVDVDAGDGGARGGGQGAADGVVEEEDAGCAGDVLEQELLDFRVVVLLDAGVVSEGGFGAGGDGGEGHEGVGVEGEVGFVGAQVLDCDGEVVVAEVALRFAGGGLLDVVEGFSVVRGGLEELEFGGYGATGDVGGVMGGYCLGWGRGRDGGFGCSRHC